MNTAQPCNSKRTLPKKFAGSVLWLLLMFLASPAQADDPAFMPGAGLPDNDACLATTTIGMEISPQLIEAMPGQLMNEPALASVYGRGAESAELQPDGSLAVILWDEPGCTNCRGSQSFSLTTGDANIQKTSLTVNRP